MTRYYKTYAQKSLSQIRSYIGRSRYHRGLLDALNTALCGGTGNGYTDDTRYEYWVSVELVGHNRYTVTLEVSDREEY